MHNKDMATLINNNSSFYKIMLGKGGSLLQDALENNYIGVGWFKDTPLVSKESEKYSNLKEFNSKWRPIYEANNPDKSKVTAGLACGTTYNVCFDIKEGDVVLSPKGDGTFAVGVVAGGYQYVPNTELTHRRKVEWSSKILRKDEISQQLKNSTGSTGTLINLTKYSDEIMRLLGEISIPTSPTIFSVNPDVEDASVFALEEHLEDFLVKNWINTPLGKHYDIYEDDENTGRQYPTDTGPLDVLAVSKDRKELLVIELKKGVPSDKVLGQILRYMGYVMDEIADDNQKVKGLIIGFDEDLKLKRALSAVENVEYYKYELNFKLKKAFE